MVETEDLGNALVPRVAVDGKGNAIAVWYQIDGLRFNVWTNFYDGATGSWGTAQLLELDNAGDAVTPDIATDSNGNAIAVWRQSDGTRFNIWASRFSGATRTWGSAQLIESDNVGDAELYPRVAVHASGDAIAVWGQSDGVRVNLWSNRFSASTGSWDSAQLIETDNAGDVRDSQVVVDGDGNAMVTWAQWDGLRFNIWASRCAALGVCGTPQSLEIGDGEAFTPQLAAGPVGSFMAVWSQSDIVQGGGIWANRYDALTGQWGTPQLIENGSGGAFHPSLTINSSGDAIVVWNQLDGTRYSIMANRYISATGTWDTAQPIEFADDTGGAYGARVSSKGRDAQAVWYKFDGAHSDIWTNMLRY